MFLRPRQFGWLAEEGVEGWALPSGGLEEGLWGGRVGDDGAVEAVEGGLLGVALLLFAELAERLELLLVEGAEGRRLVEDGVVAVEVAEVALKRVGVSPGHSGVEEAELVERVLDGGVVEKLGEGVAVALGLADEVEKKVEGEVGEEGVGLAEEQTLLLMAERRGREAVRRIVVRQGAERRQCVVRPLGADGLDRLDQLRQTAVVVVRRGFLVAPARANQAQQHRKKQKCGEKSRLQIGKPEDKWHINVGLDASGQGAQADLHNIAFGRKETKQMERLDGRQCDELREWELTLDFQRHPAGSVLVRCGNTRVICAVSVEEGVPRWMKEQGVAGGWITGEYQMLPSATATRTEREVVRGKLSGRSAEIQRLVGRSLRAAVDLDKLPGLTLHVDCDVIDADGGTRCASITGASVALQLAARRLLADGRISEWPLLSPVAAVSVGIVDGTPMLDLCYREDSAAAVDMNVVMTAAGRYVEIQGTGEEATFSDDELAQLLALARKGLGDIFRMTEACLGAR